MATMVGARQMPEHGQHIFIYFHVRTNQVVYSLTQTMNNHAALKQLPFAGKKTVPAALRKDMWRPLATVTFPSGHQGLTAYRQLREFRKRHEHEWEIPESRAYLEKWEKSKIIMDQKANTVADLAAVLLKQEKLAVKHAQEDQARLDEFANCEKQARSRIEELRKIKHENEPRMNESEDAKRVYKDAKAEQMRLKRALNDGDVVRAITGRYDPLDDRRTPAKHGLGRLRGKRTLSRMTMNGIGIRWANILDAEYAETWPSSVVHDAMQRDGNRYRHSAPPADPAPTTPSEADARASESANIQQGVGPATPSPAQRLPILEPPAPASFLSRLTARLRDGRQGT